jgi:hypothetical protein
MKNYRIKKETGEYGTRYYPQGRVFGFLWWYNIFAFDIYCDGCYSTFEEAQKELCKHLRKPVVEYIEFEPKWKTQIQNAPERPLRGM